MLGSASSAFAGANIVVVNADGAGEGFNDPTPAAPIGGNAGTTLGQQRLIAFQFAAEMSAGSRTPTWTARFIGDRDTGIANITFTTGCTLADLFVKVGVDAKNLEHRQRRHPKSGSTREHSLTKRYSGRVLF
jgi:hypothetical protein